MREINWNDHSQACAELKRLDARFGTSPDSPLHHDNRCSVHNQFMVEHVVIVSVS